MEWKAEYATGIPEIDLQHKTLLQFITDFERAVKGEMHWNTVQPLIVRAREFVIFHFAVEESLMQICNYPQLAAHRAEHQSALKQLAALEQRVLRQDKINELLPELNSWLLNHIIDSDKPFARYALKSYRETSTA